MTNGVPIVAGNQIRGVIPAIHIYDPVRMRPSDIEDVDTLEFGYVDDLDPVGCDQLPRPTRGFAARMRFVAQDVRMPVIDKRSCPGLEGNVIDVNGRVQRRTRFITVWIDRQPPVALPKALFAGRRSQIQPAVRPMWRRPCGRPG